MKLLAHLAGLATTVCLIGTVPTTVKADATHPCYSPPVAVATPVVMSTITDDPLITPTLSPYFFVGEGTPVWTASESAESTARAPHDTRPDIKVGAHCLLAIPT